MYILRKDDLHSSRVFFLCLIVYNAYILRKVGYFLNKKNFFCRPSGVVAAVRNPCLSTYG